VHEAEWEKSCKGPGGAKWPYGNGFDANTCNTEDDIGDSRSLSPAGRFAKCRSGSGVADLSGNVAEWTSERMIKGGSFASGDYAVRCSARKNGASFTKSPRWGSVAVRCSCPESVRAGFGGAFECYDGNIEPDSEPRADTRG